MKHKPIKYFKYFLLAGVLISCRNEDMFVSHETQQKMVFKDFANENSSKKRKGSYNYPRAFKGTINAWLKNHPVAVKNIAELGKTDYTNYLSFESEDKRYVALPILDAKKNIKAYVIAHVNQNRDEMEVFILHNDLSTQRQALHDYFAKAYSSKKKKAEPPVRHIEEVVIKVVKSVGGGGKSPDFIPPYAPSDHKPLVDYKTMMKCMHQPWLCDGSGQDGNAPDFDGSVGDYEPPAEPEKPCEKVNNLLGSADVKTAEKELQDYAKTNRTNMEKGFGGNKDGTVQKYPGGAFHVEPIINENTSSAHHTHPENGIPIFSVPDILTHLSLASMQNHTRTIEEYNNGIDYARNAVSAVYTNNGESYYMIFDGNSNDLANFDVNKYDKDKLMSRYREAYKELLLDPNLTQIGTIGGMPAKVLTPEGAVKLLRETLCDMGLENNIKLVTKDAAGNMNSVDMKNGNLKKEPC